ncbi:MAG TPA: hypothetical protein VFZ53_21645 [Polyangiaceae bacterium]
MTRGTLLWLAILAVALGVGLLLRSPRRERSDDSPPAASVRAPRPVDELVEVEVTEADASAPEIDESELLKALSTSWKSDPARALSLAEDGDRRFAESPRAVERRLYEIKALVELGRIGKARSKAERYLELYPPGPMTDEVERLTGVHRRPPR